MLELALRGVTTAPLRALHRVLLATALGAVACGEVEPAAPGAEIDGGAPFDMEAALALGRRYVDDPAFRRDELVRSLANPSNGYSRRRLERYTEEAWGALPEWNPRVAPVLRDVSAPPAADSGAFGALDLESVPWEEDALLELGQEAFFEYPVQVSPYLRQAFAIPDGAAHYGLWVGGEELAATRWTELPRGLYDPAVTCATCHATTDGGQVVAGRNNADLDVGALTADHAGAPPGSWGPGRVDVTADHLENPTAIADLRAVRSQTRLQRAATVQNGLIALAVRTETLIITSLGEAARPPRELAFALALYLWRLEPEPLRAPDAASRRGEPLFAAHCARCHVPPEYSGPPVALEEVGTPPEVGLSTERSTGTYRVPSLRGVGDRRRLFASGTAEDVREVLNPDRQTPGHPFGRELTASETADLIAFLETL
jgi:mono/diheme cytochrome c family protein